MLNLLAFHLPFMDQSIVILVVALLLFGKRLPEVGKSLGAGIVEFKRGLKGITDEVEEASSMPAAQYKTQQQAAAALPVATAPVVPSDHKFDPYTGQPIQPPVAPANRFDPYTGKPVGPIEGEIVTEKSHAPAIA